MRDSIKTSPMWSMRFLATVLVTFAPLAAVAADSFVIARNTGSSAAAAMTPVCGAGTFGNPDGVPRTWDNPDGVPRTSDNPDGVPKTSDNPDARGKNLFNIGRKSLTTPGQADLGVAHVSAEQVANDYKLQYCVVNRGGQSAFGPIVLAVRAGDTTLQELTIFQTLPSLRAMCFGSGSAEPAPAGTKFAGATIQVSAANGETALLDNQCRIDWKK